MLKNIITLLGLLLLSINGYAQKIDHAQGEILVQVHPKFDNIQLILKEYQLFDNKRTKIKSERCLSEAMNIWQLKFDFSSINEQAFLSDLRSSSVILNAQFNHFISLRNKPNDPDFIKQWQYINDGTLNGNIEADLDAELAWDITTGGTTVNGDTIVLCALDNGVNLNHEDIVNNLWQNHREIPNNGIDDDGNGYVDDIYGWNARNDSGDLTPQSEIHGTPVMGIMGATGNNGIGVTGVNWKVKLMMIKTDFRADEATLIAGYGYPLAMRKLYNESNGTQGAFVVATNASWGVENGRVEDAPIWCALYDSLGVVGILNCGSTLNKNRNVDIVGDLPTTCPSDFLLSVTNLNRSGEKDFSAGYGKKHIDLGSFGEDIYTLSTDGYGEFDGTSFATPHVTGAIGLLYAAPCATFGDLIKNNPIAAALLVRNYILDGVKPNESLKDITVTEGQLNLNNSLQLLMQDCGACILPLGVVTTNTVETTTTINWIKSDEGVNTTIRYRIKESNEWREKENINPPFLLTNLQVCTDYEYQLKNDCGSASSEFGEIYTFTTKGCGACTDMAYCSSFATSEDEWISKVTLNNLINESVSDVGYGDYTGQSVDLTSSEFYDLSINIGYQSASFDENIQAWIDYNQDGIFDEVTENIINLEEDIQNEYTQQFQVPADAKLGLTRMRIAIKWRGGIDATKPKPCDVIDFGEVEDYCVNIISATTSTSFSSEIQTLNLYPNPVKDNLLIEIDLKEATDLRLALFNSMGQVIRNKKVVISAEQQIITMDLRDLPKGIYFLNIETNKGQLVKKVVKN